VTVAALAASAAGAATITIPAAASIQGISPFFSDVRVFNTSYTSAVNITATYYCFLGACPGTAPQITIALASRDSQAFNDIVANAFASPNSAGGIELTFDGDPNTIIVTSRLYSTSPNPTVGMFIPGLDNSQAHQLSALVQVQSGDAAGNGGNGNNGAGFRTNVGIYNPNDTPATVTFTGFANHAPVGGNVERLVPAHSGVQINGFFDQSGALGVVTDNGVVLVQSDVPVFSYAAVIDNNTSDPYLVIGALDQSNGSITPGPTGTPGQQPTRTSTPIATRTPRLTPPASGSPTVTPASASPLVRRVAGSAPRPVPAPGAAQAGSSRIALLFEERYQAVLRGIRPGAGGW
jgi:hypothetical protein